MAMSNYLENKVLDHVMRGTVYTPPTNYYVALFATSPGDDNTGTEISSGGYVRQEASFTAASNGMVKNTAEIAYPVATENIGEIAHVAVFDAQTDGNLLFYGTLTEAKFINLNDQFKILAGDLTISLD